MALMVCPGCSTRYAPGLERCPHCGQTGGVEEGSRGSRLPFLDVTCTTAGCRAEGVVRRIHMPMIVPGVVEQPAYVCVPCGAVMLLVGGWPPPGIGENMPKITRHGGPTNRNDPAPVPPAPAEPEGGEEPSAGNSSSTSAAKPPSSPETKKASRPRRARTTASPSKAAPEASSTADGTGSSGPATPDEDTGDA